MGRWQPLPGHPHAVCDTGHNVAGWQMLAPQIMAQPARKRRLVFGMVDDKDLAHVMELLPRDATYYWTQPSTHRAFPAEKVAACGRAHGLHGTLHPSVAEAYRAALADAAPRRLHLRGWLQLCRGRPSCQPPGETITACC